MKSKLILYDIDGTLVTTGGAGIRALDRAFEHVFGIKDAFNGIPMAGRTDTQIMKEGLKTHGFPHMDGHLTKMQEGYLHFLKEEVENPDRAIMPGILDSIEVLKGMGMTIGLLTGNLEKGARIKLGAQGLNEHFEDGAFGSDHEDRNQLLPIAIEKYRAKGLVFNPKDCIIIGDTPKDVRCAKIHGGQCIAVATGPYSKEDLLKTDADIVLDTLENRDNYINFITS